MTRLWTFASAVCCAAAVASGCGGGGSSSVEGDGTLHVTLGEYQMRPDTATVPDGTVTITVQNLGRLTHDLVVADGAQWLGATKPLWPGQSAQLTLTLLPGKYTMFSALLSDQALGDYGTLTVTK